MNKENKRILIISEVFYPEIGSGANRITNLQMYFKNRGYKVDVITSEPSYPNKEIYLKDEYRDLEKEKNIYENSNVYRVKASNAKRNDNFFLRLFIYMSFFIKSVFLILFNKEKYEVVLATIPSPFVGVLGIIAKMKFRCRYILDIRDLWPECIKNIGLFRKNKFLLKFAYLLENLIFKFSDSIVINSNGFRDYITKKNYKKDIVFIPNGMQAKELDNYKRINKESDKNEKFTVIYSGMIGLPQNITSIVKVARNLKSITDIEFKIIGTGVQKDKVLELIKRYELKNIKVYEPMPKSKVIEELAKSHIGLAHLRKDSAFDLVVPGKIIDYMGIGIPIVAGVQGYAANLIKDSNSGLVSEPDDYIGLSKAILKIYKDRNLKEQYSRNGMDYCRSNFCIENNLIKYIELIEKVTRRRENAKEDKYVCVESLY